MVTIINLFIFKFIIHNKNSALKTLIVSNNLKINKRQRKQIISAALFPADPNAVKRIFKTLMCINCKNHFTSKIKQKNPFHYYIMKREV